MVALGTPICTMQSQIPGWFCLSFPLGMQRRPCNPQAAAQLCLLAQYFPPWAHLWQAAATEPLKLHLQGRRELWGGCEELDVGLWQPSPTDPERQHHTVPGSSYLQRQVRVKKMQSESELKIRYGCGRF